MKPNKPCLLMLSINLILSILLTGCGGDQTPTALSIIEWHSYAYSPKLDALSKRNWRPGDELSVSYDTQGKSMVGEGYQKKVVLSLYVLGPLLPAEAADSTGLNCNLPVVTSDEQDIDETYPHVDNSVLKLPLDMKPGIYAVSAKNDSCMKMKDIVVINVAVAN